MLNWSHLVNYAARKACIFVDSASKVHPLCALALQLHPAGGPQDVQKTAERNDGDWERPPINIQ